MADAKSGAMAAICILAAVAVLAGFATSGSPLQARKEQRDLTRWEDLQRLSQNIACRAGETGTLPETPGATRGCAAPLRLADPYTGSPYDYRPTGPRHWRLCAGFEQPDLLRRTVMSDRFDADQGCLLDNLPGDPAASPDAPPVRPGTPSGDPLDDPARTR